MSTSIIQQKVTDPEFSDSAYSYVESRTSHTTTNTFPSSPTVTNNMYNFSVAKSGYKAVGVVSYSIGDAWTDIVMHTGEYCTFNYSNQTVSLYFRASSSSSFDKVTISATIKYLKL